MATPERPVQLKVFVDKTKKKVMFAEAAEDFVDILFSFFTLPLGTIAKLSSKHLKDIKVGSLTSLYESVVSLDAKHFAQGWYKDDLLNPGNSSASICQKLKVNLDDTKTFNPSVASCHGDAVLVKNMTNFIITDELNVVPVMPNTSILLYNSLVENNDSLEERTMYFGYEEFLNLLNWSLLTNNPLTNMVLGGGKPCSSCTTYSTLSSSALISSNSSQTRTKLKLLIQKSNKKLLCAQGENHFVELLFSFLTTPLGAVIRLTKDGSSSSGISNLYISCLGDRKYLKSEDVKTMLLFPKIAAKYLRVTDCLPIYEVNTRPRHFLMEQAPFIISNDLEIIVSPSIATILRLNTLAVPPGDMEFLEVSIGENEALSLLKASLTSTSALTDFLNEPRKKPNVEPST